MQDTKNGELEGGEVIWVAHPGPRRKYPFSTISFELFLVFILN
jgi:hypothetical protein